MGENVVLGIWKVVNLILHAFTDTQLATYKAITMFKVSKGN